MIRLLAILAVVLLVGKIAYQMLVPAPVTTVSTLSPEQQLQNIVTTRVATAEQLGTLCDTYPQLAAKYLRNGTPIQLTGTVQDFRIAGLNGRRAYITLYQCRQRPLIAVYDLDHYSVLGLSPIEDHQTHYVIVENELLAVNKQMRTPVFTREKSFTDTVTLASINPSDILVDGTAK